MDKDFEEFISVRCGRALEECRAYIESELNGELSQDELQIIAEKLCYKKGFKDAMAIVKCSHNL